MAKDKPIYHTFNRDPFHTHMKLLKRVVPGSSVLEVGCATGYFTSELLRKNCTVCPLEKDKKAAQIAKKRTKVKVINCDVNFVDKFIPRNRKFDFILLADILEHLVDPLTTLIKLKEYLKPNGKMLISLPNIANFSIRLNLLFLGNFTYKDYGILDRTHLRFFTKESAEKMLRRTGLQITYFDVVAGFDVSSFYAKTIGRITFRILPLRFFEYFLTKLFPNFLALEFIYEVKIK